MLLIAGSIVVDACVELKKPHRRLLSKKHVVAIDERLAYPRGDIDGVVNDVGVGVVAVVDDNEGVVEPLKDKEIDR